MSRFFTRCFALLLGAAGLFCAAPLLHAVASTVWWSMTGHSLMPQSTPGEMFGRMYVFLLGAGAGFFLVIGALCLWEDGSKR